MKRPKTKRGRPALGAAARIRATYTLSRAAVESLATLARENGTSRSRMLEAAIERVAKPQPFALPAGDLAGLCHKRGIHELWLFGSALRADFGPESDIDLLVSFNEGACRSYFDFVETQTDLAGYFGRKVDMVEEHLIDNPLRRAEILAHRERIYGA